jgi:dihydropyrimidinase
MGEKYATVVKNGLVVYPEKTVRADIGIGDGVVRAIAPPGEIQGRQVLEAGGCYVLPGLIDPHTHPVYVDSIGDLSRLAAFGGVTTLIHYTYAKPGQSLVEMLRKDQEAGQAISTTDFALHGGMFETGKQVEEIPEAFRLGVTSFKMFMAYAKLGWMTDDYALTRAMDIIGRLGGLTAVHAESGLAIDYIQDRMLAEKADFAERFLETSPDVGEAEGIFRAVSLGRLMGCPVYIPHLSSREAVEVMRWLKARGIQVYAETCPHYLTLTWEELKGRGPLGKIGPAIKTADDRDALWAGIREGLFDTIGSDHAPKDKKPTDDFFKAPYGVAGAETVLPLVWHQGVNGGRITPNQLVRLLSENAARIFGLFPQKGRLEAGSDADLVIFDPAERWTIRHENQHSNVSYTLYEGREVLGRVRQVLSRGQLTIDRQEFLGKPGAGRFLATRAGWRILPRQDQA